MSRIPLCDTSAIPVGRAKGFDIDKQKVFVVRTPSSLFAYENSCPHQYVPLDWDNDEFLDSSGELILCATHGAQFVIETGKCVAGPCVGSSLRSRKIEVDNSQVYIHTES